MKDYINGCLNGILYILIGSLLLEKNTCVLVITILITFVLIIILPYKNNKSLYFLFLEKYFKL